MSKTNRKGFTIIEVVLVLAIAGLIFLMVFIALPALQRGQRNTQRRQDLSRVVSAITAYKANNRNNLPLNQSSSSGGGGVSYTVVAGFASKYVGADNSEERTDPDGEQYTISASATGLDASAPFNHTILIVPGAKCGTSEGTLEYNQGKAQFAVQMVLEGGAIACVDDQ